MIIEYKIPFSNFRKAARTYCKIVQIIKTPFAKRRLLKHLDGKNIDYRHIPVIINNYNRINHLVKLIDWLEKAEMQNIYIIDNASTYPLLLDFYSQTKHTVVKLNANIGYKALWDTSIHLWFKGLPYIYTDPDILPIEECPVDAIKHFQEILDKYEDINKVGFGLQIDDIPDHYANKSDVLKWEMKYWENPISEQLYKADIDTTFALYRAHSVKQQWGKTIRTGGKYLARHLPWYENTDSLSEEELYYRKMSICSTWYSKKKVV
jgi:hypothetical protein